MSNSQYRGLDLTLVIPSASGWAITTLFLTGIKNYLLVGIVLGTTLITSYTINRLQQNQPKHTKISVSHPLQVVVLTLLVTSLLGFSAHWHYQNHQRALNNLNCLSSCQLNVTLKRFPTPNSYGYTATAVVSTEPDVTVLLSGKELKPYKVNDQLTVSGHISKPGAPPSLGLFKIRTITPQKLSFAHNNSKHLSEALTGVSETKNTALIQAMTLGDLSQMPPEKTQLLRQVGIAHLVAISGFHLAVILGALGKIIPGKPRQKIFPLSAALILITLAVGAQPSVIRASTMVGLSLIGAILGRHVQGMNSLAVVVIVWLTFDPWLAKSTGFLLSVSATVAVLAAVIWEQTREKYEFASYGRQLWEALRPLLAVAVGAHLLITPIVVMQLGKYSLYAIVLNMLVTPFVPLITGGGVLILLLSYVFPASATLIGWMVTYPAQLLLTLAEICGQLPGASLTGKDAAIALAVQYLLVVAGFLIRRRMRSLKYGNAKQNIERAGE